MMTILLIRLINDFHQDDLKKSVVLENLHDSAVFTVNSKETMLEKANSIGVLSTENEDIRSLRQMIIYGLKGMAAYTEHAENIGKENIEINAFIYEALAATLDDSLSADDLVALTLKTGEHGVKAMALLDEANTSKYGNPEITEVNIGVRKIRQFLFQDMTSQTLNSFLSRQRIQELMFILTAKCSLHITTLLLKKYSNFVGNYGNSWWKQLEEFETFKGAILFTTNCIVPPKSEEVRSRIFTTGSCGYPGCRHIEANENGKKDFSEIIELAKKLPLLKLETGSIVSGFAHNQVFALCRQGG